MTENTTNTKRTALHIIIAEILGVILSSLTRKVSFMFINNMYQQGMHQYDKLISDISNSFSIVLVLAVYLLTGYIMTKDKRKSIIFASTLSFSSSIVGIVYFFISSIYNCIDTTDAYIYLPDSDIFFTIISIIEIPFVILAAFFFYTALEGNNKKISGSLITSEMTLSRAKKRYIGYSVIGGIAIGIILSIPSAVLLLLKIESDIAYSTIIGLTEWFTSILILAFMYLAGYRAYKSHVDAIAFSACSALIAKISSLFFFLYSVFVDVLSTKLTELRTSPIGDSFYYYLDMVVSVDYINSIISFVVCLLLAIVLFKYFFSDAKINLFTEQELVTSETETEE